ncbi:hypothetical protein JI739_13470 [Ramlibacter sp. AW1]|uniref:Uncharacterized protein n=1 Tax=Ramlibacter aurantiacus TaxID=2801330 RepID=A0A936ZJI8_9BURK|nr:hypothetical protein [Ramlibacter aurantiacus]MBL0421363.1 hypothetical protein [Ramlibacter aurantiacus]
MTRLLALTLSAAAISLPGAASADMFFGGDKVQPPVESSRTRSEVRTDVMGAGADYRNLIVERYPFPLERPRGTLQRSDVRNETRPAVRSGILPEGEADPYLPSSSHQ